ncbi:hypothetical protein L873DRAFT_1062117 [Choiromyces venosus 120613-1]|uniref:Uncharacterized protein n=1 Tax=Choiromyces venosus 120613-1 TaxID=1336337 RepID=A0A3N4IRG9_9PEZI|nr:hypothetical protein L873DRAFT_1062117 [Choiromyces venosus 120613-1]
MLILKKKTKHKTDTKIYTYQFSPSIVPLQIVITLSPVTPVEHQQSHTWSTERTRSGPGLKHKRWRRFTSPKGDKRKEGNRWSKEEQALPGVGKRHSHSWKSDGRRKEKQIRRRESHLRKKQKKIEKGEQKYICVVVDASSVVRLFVSLYKN